MSLETNFQTTSLEQLLFDLPVKLVEAETKTTALQRWQVSSVRVETANQIFCREPRLDNFKGKGNTYYFAHAQDGLGPFRLRLCCSPSNPIPSGDIEIPGTAENILPTDKWNLVCSWKSN